MPLRLLGQPPPRRRRNAQAAEHEHVYSKELDRLARLGGYITGPLQDQPDQVHIVNGSSDPHVWGFLALGPRAPWGPTLGPPQGPGRAWPAPRRCSRFASFVR